LLNGGFAANAEARLAPPTGIASCSEGADLVEWRDLIDLPEGHFSHSLNKAEFQRDRVSKPDRALTPTSNISDITKEASVPTR
jgi:hypothetical protein